MDLIQLLPAAVTIAIIGVVILTELFKRLDKKDRLKGYRVYLPAVFSFGFAGLLRIGDFITPGQIWFYWTMIFAVSVFAFEAILKKVTTALLKIE